MMRTIAHVWPAACSAALMLASLAHAQSCGQSAWTQIQTDTAPSPRNLASMVYDEARDRLVFFGGYTGSAYSDETWEYDLATALWILREPAQRPSPRGAMAMVYDTQRQRTILVGGSAEVSMSTTLYNDTWEWDGDSWTQRATAGAPAPRRMHNMVYDPTRSIVVLYGGRGPGSTTYADTWEFNPATGAWIQVAPAGSPGQREQHAMAFDPARGRPILFGGVFGATAAQGTWEYVVNGSNRDWVNRTNAGPSGRTLMSMVTDPGRGRVLLYGGGPPLGPALDDLWEWNGAEAAWTLLAPASAMPTRRSYTWAFSPARRAAYLHGGLEGAGVNYRNDTWQLAFAQPPVILSQPTSFAAAQGGAAVLSVQAAGTGLSYRWRRGGQPLMPSNHYLGITTPTLTILDADAGDIGSYDVVVTNACGSVTSNSASVSLSCAANCDGSTTPPVLNINDFLCFQQKFAAGCP